MKISVFKTLPLVAATAAAIGLANTAQADAYAVSAANVTDLVITVTTVPATPPPGIPIVTGLVDSTASATLQGATDISTATVNALAVNAPGSNPANTRLDNVYNQFGQTNANYSNADASVDSEQTEGDAFTQVRSIGESFGVGELTITGSLGENKSVTGFFFSIQLADTASLSFDFNAFKYLQAALTADATIPGSSAQATLNVVVTINDALGNTVFSWAPDGQAGGITGGTETADAFSLNQNIQNVFPGTSPTSTSGLGCTISAVNMAVGTGVGNLCFGNFAAFTNDLAPGAYTLGLSAKSSTAITSVPVPGTLALMGLGLLGFCSSMRRRVKKA
jgi:hypothetical protein